MQVPGRIKEEVTIDYKTKSWDKRFFLGLYSTEGKEGMILAVKGEVVSKMVQQITGIYFRDFFFKFF